MPKKMTAAERKERVRKLTKSITENPKRREAVKKMAARRSSKKGY